MVIDIDPSSKNTFIEVVDTALATKKILDKAGVTSYCKTSGASGLHVYVPMKNKYDYTTVKDFAHIIASLVQEQLPDTTSLERSLKKRGDKIYIDYLQNRSGQTLASVYSLRPKKGATVSTPLDWKEVTHKLHPSQFTIENILERVQKKGDLFEPVLTGTTNIEKALKASAPGFVGLLGLTQRWLSRNSLISFFTKGAKRIKRNVNVSSLCSLFLCDPLRETE